MKSFRKQFFAMASVVALSTLMMASAAGAVDKLKVQDGSGNDVFKVDDAGAVSAKSFNVLNAAGTANVMTTANTGLTTISNATGADTNTLFQIKDTAGNPTFYYSPNGYVTVQGASSAQISEVVYAGNGSGTQPLKRAVVGMTRYRGTASAPLPVMLNDSLGTLGFNGYDGAAPQGGALMEAYVDGPIVASVYSGTPPVLVTQGSVPMRFSIVTGSSSTTRYERLVIKNDGKIGVGTNAPTNILHIAGNSMRIDTARTPSGACNAGEISWDDSFIYVCITSGIWKKATLQ